MVKKADVFQSFWFQDEAFGMSRQERKEALSFVASLDVKSLVCALKVEEQGWSGAESSRRSRRNWFITALRLVKTTLNYKVFWRSKHENEVDVLVIGFSLNQCHSLSPVVDELKSSGLSVLYEELVEKGHCQWFDGLNRFQALVKTVSFLKMHPGARAKDRSFDINVYKVFRNARIIHKSFKQVNPAYLLVSNDHTPRNLLLAACARFLDVPSGYVQHAHVTLNFPPPTYFTDLFLDGWIAARVYSDLSQGLVRPPKIHQVGPVRFQNWKRTVNDLKGDQKACIGIGMDYHCDLLQGNDFQALQAYPARFAVRFHPRTAAKLKSSTVASFHKYGINVIEFDDASAEAFLSQINTLITGMSSLALDAAYQRVPSLILRNTSDYYGFLQEGLVQNAETLPETLELFNRMIEQVDLEGRLEQYFFSADCASASPSQRVVNIIIGQCQRVTFLKTR